MKLDALAGYEAMTLDRDAIREHQIIAIRKMAVGLGPPNQCEEIAGLFPIMTDQDEQ